MSRSIIIYALVQLLMMSSDSGYDLSVSHKLSLFRYLFVLPSSSLETLRLQTLLSGMHYWNGHCLKTFVRFEPEFANLLGHYHMFLPDIPYVLTLDFYNIHFWLLFSTICTIATSRVEHSADDISSWHLDIHFTSTSSSA